VQALVAKAKLWALQLGKPVQLWMSDKQDAFVKAIATEFPKVPHRFCQNHFLRDVAKPTLEADSHAKVKMRKKIRGLRAIEKEVLTQRRDQAAAAAAAAAAQDAAATAQPVPPPAKADTESLLAEANDDAGDVVLDYCAGVRGILNDGQGGPLHPPGLRMAEALGEVRESLQRNLDAKKGGGAPRGN
jgi:hypothetical protein